MSNQINYELLDRPPNQDYSEELDHPPGYSLEIDDDYQRAENDKHEKCCGWHKMKCFGLTALYDVCDVLFHDRRRHHFNLANTC